MRYHEIIRTPRGFRTFVMTRGTTLYHGTGASFDPISISSPCWVSTSFDVAKWFVDWHNHYTDDDPEDLPDHHKGNRIVEYKLTRAVRLLYVEGPATFNEISERFDVTMHGSEDMAENVCKLGFEGWYIENNYREGDDTMICDSSVLKFVQIHRV